MKRAAKQIYKYWKKFAEIIGKINSTIVLSVIFFLVFGTYALVKKIFLFSKRNEKKALSFWREKKYIEPVLENLRRQF